MQTTTPAQQPPLSPYALNIIDSPSVRDGIPPHVEIAQKRTTCAFLQEAGIKLKL